MNVLSADGDLALLAEDIGRLEGVAEVQVAGSGLRVRLSKREGMIAALVSAAERSGVELADVTISQSTLETVFIHLTGRDLRE